jgi:hypothetical protein
MLLAVILACVGAAPPADTTIYEFQLRLSGPDGVISRPVMRTVAHQQAMVSVGQTVSLGGELVDVGVKMRVVAVPVEGKQVQLRMMTEVTELDGPNSTLSQSSIHLRTIEPGKHLRLRVGEKGGEPLWLDLDLLRLP